MIWIQHQNHTESQSAPSGEASDVSLGTVGFATKATIIGVATMDSAIIMISERYAPTRCWVTE